MLLTVSLRGLESSHSSST